MNATKIEWADASWNPITGCLPVSSGCKNCYAAQLAGTRLKENKRYVGLATESNGRGHWTGAIHLHADKLLEPYRKSKPKKIFVCDMSDLFYETVPDSFIDKVFAVMACSCRMTFQVLTKRAGRMADYLFKVSDEKDRQRWAGAAAQLGMVWPEPDSPLPNVWLGVSVETKQEADKRIPLLQKVPASMRFLSCEPLLGPLDLSGHLNDPRGFFAGASELESAGKVGRKRGDIHWVIVGGESGPQARPCDIEWIHDIVRQCDAEGVPVFVKQLGSYPLYHLKHPDGARVEPGRIVCRDKKGADPGEWPAFLRVRDFPAATAPTE